MAARSKSSRSKRKKLKAKRRGRTNPRRRRESSRKPKRLLDSLDEARALLDREVEKNRHELLKTLSYPGAPTHHDPESVVR